MRKRYYQSHKDRTEVVSYREIAIEATAKLAIHVVLSAVAISCLVRLLPHHQSMQDKLGELQTQVKRKEQQVQRLQQEFNSNFSLDRSISVMEEQSHRIEQKRRPVVLRNPIAIDDVEPIVSP